MSDQSVFLKSGREKSLLRRHPWVFSGAVRNVTGSPKAGDTVTVRNDKGDFLAVGAYSPASAIPVRIWSFTEEAIDREFFRRRIAQAVFLREKLGLMDINGGCRLIYSESDSLPGVIVDR